MKKCIVVMLVLSFMVISCGKKGSNSDDVQRKQTEKSMQEMNRQVGMPAIINFQEKKLAKMLFERRDKANLVTYTYIVTLSGAKVFLGKSIGYGLPYSIQYTNPEKLVRADLGAHYGDIPMPQADPNGLYMPPGLSATWVMLVNPKTGKAEPIYIENEIIVSPFKIW